MVNLSDRKKVEIKKNNPRNHSPLTQSYVTVLSVTEVYIVYVVKIQNFNKLFFYTTEADSVKVGAYF